MAIAANDCFTSFDTEIDLLEVPNLLITILTSGGVSFLLKKWFEHSLDAKIKVIQTQLDMKSYEHQVEYSRFDARRTLAIEGAYELVCEYSEMVTKVVEQLYLDGAGASQDSWDRTEAIAKKFSSFMLRHSIYLPEDIVEKLKEVRFDLRDAYQEELNNFRTHQHQMAEGKKMSPFLLSLFRGSGLQRRCEDLMAELQKMVRDHLCKFKS